MKNIKLKKDILINQGKKRNIYNRGITLIALVITIIVLLILASVSISMLTGQNGILTQAQNAKIGTEQASTREKVDLAIVGAMAKTENGTLTVENLKSELLNYDIVPKNTKFPLEIEKDGQKLTINSNGDTLSYKEMGEITGKETENTSTKDSLGNYIVIPAGFKVINPNDNVTDGIVVEDVDHGATAGSQFVWIPVGDVIKDSEENIETITLGRYVFNEDGTVNDELSKMELGEQLKTNPSASYYFTEELKESITTNTHAKDIEDFKNKAINNQGYYIGRYEARDKDTTVARTSSSNKTNQVVCTANNYVYNNVTQPEAATLSREMYKDNNFESDLINSYAWDTAIVFLQKFDNRTDTTVPYSRQSSLNIKNVANYGTINLENKNMTDAICNVYDMGSNCIEWSTETCSHSGLPSTLRGSYYNNSIYYTSIRDGSTIDFGYDGGCFRVLIYM